MQCQRASRDCNFSKCRRRRANWESDPNYSTRTLKLTTTVEEIVGVVNENVKEEQLDEVLDTASSRSEDGIMF